MMRNTLPPLASNDLFGVAQTELRQSLSNATTQVTRPPRCPHPSGCEDDTINKLLLRDGSLEVLFRHAI